MAKTTIPVELSSTPGITDNSNATAITIDANEKVGVGTASPAQTLHVNSGASNVVARFESSDSIAAASFKDNNGEAEIGNIGNDIGFFPAGAEKVRIDSSGNVLIGATSTNTGGFGSISPQLLVAGTMPQVALHETDTDKDGYIGISSSTMFIQTADAIPMRFGTNDAERMRIDSTGKVGIGTTSPGHPLNVVDSGELQAEFSGYSHASAANNSRAASGSIRLGNGAGSTGLLLDYTDQGQTVGLIKNEYVASSSSELRLQSPFLSFYTGTSAAERMRIDSSGKVGIGTSSPAEMLHIVGAGNGPEIRLANSSGSHYIRAYNDNWNFLANSTNTAMTIRNSGQVDFGAGLGIGGTGTANTLDDYEEGTWTPTINSGTISGAGGYYTKIGRVVTVSYYYNLTTLGSSTATVVVGGLPFAAKTAGGNGQQSVGSILCRYFSKNQIVSYLGDNDTNLYYYNNGTGDFDSITFGEIEVSYDNDFAAHGTHTYITS